MKLLPSISSIVTSPIVRASYTYDLYQLCLEVPEASFLRLLLLYFGTGLVMSFNETLCMSIAPLHVEKYTLCRLVTCFLHKGHSSSFKAQFQHNMCPQGISAVFSSLSAHTQHVNVSAISFSVASSA